MKISAKDLGSLAMPDFCPRCFWLRRNVKKLPFQIFPGIFSSIDSYTKKVVHDHFDQMGNASLVIPGVHDAKKYLKAPHWSKFNRTDRETGITISGTVDDLFETESGSHIIVDYKTAKYTEGQDRLLPLYEAQLNGYAWIDEGMGHTIHSLYLIYCEPITDVSYEGFTYEVDYDGFAMLFVPKVVQIKHDTKYIPALLQVAAKILAEPRPPEGVIGCKDCDAVDEVVRALCV